MIQQNTGTHRAPVSRMVMGVPVGRHNMNRFFAPFVLLAASVALLAAAPAALANRGVNDPAKFFSEQGERQATSIIDDIYRKHHGQEVYVETAQAVPDNQDYAAWADQKTKESRTNGVYILIVRKGGRVHVVADTEASRLFTRDVRNALASRLHDNLAKGPANFDAALLDAVNQVNDTYQRGERQPGGTDAPRTQGAPAGGYVPNAPSRTSTVRSCGALPGSLMGWVCLIAGVWIVFGLIRGVMRGRGGGYGPGGPGYGGGGPGYGGYGGGGYGGGMMGGGGGWGSSILGGMFGAVAGNWLYNHIGGGGSANAAPPMDPGYGGGAAGPSSPDWAGPTDTSSGYESSDAGGGADFGTGGGGGADFGGGGGADFGGGGGDFGGGGGGDAGGGGDFA